MKLYRKQCAIILALVIAIAVLPCSRMTAAAATKAPKITAKASLLMHGTKTLKIQKNGYKITKVVSVKSSNQKIARATASKKAVTVYGIKNGTAKITVKVKAKKSKKTKKYNLTTTVKVKTPAFKLSKKSIQVGKNAKITKSNLIKKASVQYTASGKCVTVTKSGKITGKAAGSAKIRAKVTFPKAKYAKKKIVTYTVGTVKVTDSKSPELYMLRSTFVTWVGGAVGVSPVSRGTKQVDFSKITYTSSNPRVAKISKKNNNGCVIGVSKGTATITMKSKTQTLKAKVVVLAKRTDAKASQDFYEYERTRKLKELAKAGITVQDGEEFCGYNAVEGNIQKSLQTYADEIYRKVKANGGKSIYKDNTPNDAIASLITTYREDADTQTADLKNDLAGYLAPLENAGTTDELMSLNAEIIACGNRGFWKNGEVATSIDKEGIKPGKKVCLRPDLTTAFALDRKADYDNNDATAATLRELIDGLLEVSGETKEQRAENVPRVLAALKALAPEKTMQDIYSSGLSGNDLEEELVRNGYDGGFYPVGKVVTDYPHIRFADSIRGTVCTDDSQVQIYPVGPLQRLDALVAGGDADSLRELLKVCIAYPYYIETRDGYEVNYRFTQARAGQTAEESQKALDNKYEALLAYRLSNDYGWETAAAYTEDKFRGNSEKELRTMMERIRSEYKTAIQNASWMSKTTRTNALKKIMNMQFDLFGPEDYGPYITDQDLKTAGEGGTLFTNIQAFNTGKWNSLGSWIDQKYYRKDCYWRNLYGNITPTGEMTPLFPNGSYEPSANCIAIWVGLLDREMYIPGKTIYNYGRVGAAIAHEIGHGFDSSGMQYDDEGNRKSIIAPADVSKWEAKCSQLAKVFSNYSVYFDPKTEQFLYADGQTELPEIMSDVGGDEIVASVVQKDYPGDKNLKQLFSTVCMLWNSESFDPANIERGDIHPHGKLRGTLSLQMLDPFYDVLDIRQGDAMYIAPDQRMRIWDIAPVSSK